MSLSPFFSFQSRFVNYLLTFPRNTIQCGKPKAFVVPINLQEVCRLIHQM